MVILSEDVVDVNTVAPPKIMNSPCNVEQVYEVEVNFESTNNEFDLGAYGINVEDVDVEAFDDSDKRSVDDVDNMTDDEELCSFKSSATEFIKNKTMLGIDFSENVLNEEGPSFSYVTPMGGSPTVCVGEDVDEVFLQVDEAWKNDTQDMEENESNYDESSDGNHSPYDSSEEDDWVYGYDGDKRRKRNSDIVSFNSKVNIKDFDFCINMTFDGPEQFKHVLREYASSGGYPVYFAKNTDKKIQVKCNKEKVILSTIPPKSKYVAKCPWKIWVIFMQNEKTFVVKTYKNVHTCTSHRRLKIVRTKWLETKYGEKVRANPFMKVTQLQDEIMKDLGVEVTYTQCFRLKRMALAEAEKSLRGHYAMLWRYAGEVYRANPGSTFYIMTADRENPIGPRFKRLYMCFDAVKKGWKSGCRPIIGIDGCFLKTFCTGELLSAIGRDGNDQMYPIAWAVVEVENKETWLWFLTHLIEDLGLNDGQGLTLMSDKQKGLIEAVKQLLPYSEHRHCARHIYANFRDKFPGQIYKKLFWTAAKATTLGEYNKVMKEIRKLSENAFIELEQKQDPHSWARCFFKTDCKCDVVDNNMSEAFNSWILKSRYKPLLFMLEDIRRQVMVRLQKNRDLMLKNELKFGKRIHIKLNNSIMASRKCTSTWNGDNKFEVRDDRYGAVTVDLNLRCCSCRKWDLTGIPCEHGVSALACMRLQPDDYVSDWYKKETYLRGYGHMMTPHNGMTLWPEDTRLPIRPPLIRKMPGRPKRKRRREVGEQKKKSTNTNRVNTEGDSSSEFKASKKGTTIKCSICKKDGHNKARCPHRPLDDPTIKKKQRAKKTNEEVVSSHQCTRGILQDDVDKFGGMPTFVRWGKSFIHGSSLSKKANRRN